MEPVFAYVFIRNVMDDTEMIEVNPVLRETLERARPLQRRADEKDRRRRAPSQHIDEIPEDIKRVFVCAHDVSPLYHVKMQAAFQKHTDNAVSKTVNFAHGATMEDVARGLHAGLRARLQGRHHLP